jgi:hypothetical protein
MDFPKLRCGKGIRIRRPKRIRKFKRIKTQPLCGENPS